MIHAFVFSKLFYCSTVWRNTSKRNINKLQLVQNFACRIILGLKKFDHISEGLKALNWLRVTNKQKLKKKPSTLYYVCTESATETHFIPEPSASPNMSFIQVAVSVVVQYYCKMYLQKTKRKT